MMDWDLGGGGGRRTAGCDGKVDQSPEAAMKFNPCLVCQDTVLPMSGICGWDKVPCRPPKALDDCGVCQGANSRYRGVVGAGMNIPAHLDSRAASGVCDFRGVKCGCTVGGLEVAAPLTAAQRAAQQCSPATVSVCGSCVLLDERWNQPLSGQPSPTQTFKNVGICDCSGNGVPNGGAILDRCGVCNGRNSSMDYCGSSPDIPPSAVCHTGAAVSAESSTWNLSCTGCDGVPDPSRPWFPSPVAVNRGYGTGGVRVDVCGVCGGDSSTCAGCDGVPGSAARLDACGVCGGDNRSCFGCDGVAQPRPVVNDSCGTCGGSKFGACACDYAKNTDATACAVGCDGVVGSAAQVDACGVCGGNGASCAGCDGVSWSGRVWDACGMCRLPALACLGCDGVPNSFQRFDCRGVCNGGGQQCAITPCPAGTALDECGACTTPEAANRSCGGCDDLPYSMRLVDVCGVCDGDGRSCLPTLRSLLAPCTGGARGSVVDACGVCGGPGPNASGFCLGRPDVHAVRGTVRLIGVQSIDELLAAQAIFASGIQDAAGNPTAVAAARVRVVQACGPSGSGRACSTGELTRPQPPKGSVDVTFEVVVGDIGARAQAARAALRRRPFQAKLAEFFAANQRPGVVAQWVQPPCFGYDACGVLCGDGRSCLVCGRCGRNASTGLCIRTDACGACGGDGSSCRGCDGVPYSGRTFDACGVCGGDGTACKGCDGVAYSGATLDRCGVCGGGNRDVDACGCCPGSAPLCYLTPTSKLCPPLCVADNTTCMGCDGALDSGRAVDACGVCGGTNLCKFETQTFTIGGRRAANTTDADPDAAAGEDADEPGLFHLWPQSAAARRSPDGLLWAALALAVAAAAAAASSSTRRQ